jgi:hypothetical protein
MIPAIARFEIGRFSAARQSMKYFCEGRIYLCQSRKNSHTHKKLRYTAALSFVCGLSRIGVKVVANYTSVGLGKRPSAEGCAMRMARRSGNGE